MVFGFVIIRTLLEVPFQTWTGVLTSMHCMQGAAMTIGIHVYMAVVPALLLQMGTTLIDLSILFEY